MKFLVAGPSHVGRWKQRIAWNQFPKLDGCDYMYAEAGGAIFSLHMKNYIEMHAEEVDKIFIFVSDFRFGNNYLKENKTFTDLFITGYSHPDKTLISPENDFLMYTQALKVLDWYVAKYKEKVQFIFWCLNYREIKNIQMKKYMVDGKYTHPVWNYSYLRSRYAKNIVDISVINDSIEEYTLDNQGHPSMKGFSYLYHCFELKGAQHAMNKVNEKYMNIMKQLFK